MVWTNKKEQLLTQLWIDGVALEAIALDVGCTPEAAAAKRARLGLPGRSTVGRQEHIKDLCVRLDINLHQDIRSLASKRRTTVSRYVRHLIECDIKREKTNGVIQSRDVQLTLGTTVELPD